MSWTRIDEALASLPPLERPEDELALARELRRHLPPEEARRATELAVLRRRARGRLAHAERLWLTKKGLEQATDARVARLRAERLAAWDAGAWVLDGTAGLGGDALALAMAGLERVVAAERDPEIAIALAHNLELAGGAAHVVVQDAERLAVRAEALVLDPDRRPDPGGARVGDPDRWSPAWASVRTIVEGVRAACVKLAPAVDVARLAPPRVPHRFEWVSLGGELKEVALWTGELGECPPGEREVTLVRRDGGVSRWCARPADASPCADPGSVRWIVDPDPAVIRAELIGRLARELELAPLARASAYLGGDVAPNSPLGKAYEVLGSAPLDRRRVRALLKGHDVGPLTVKKRGHPDDAATLAKRFRGSGTKRGTLLVARLDAGHRAFLVRRNGSETSTQKGAR